MKKILLTISSIVLTINIFAQQVPSPFWNTLQNTNFPTTSAGLLLMDVVDANVVWGIGNYGTNGRFSNLFTTTSNGGALWTVDSIMPDTNTWQISNIDGVDANTAWVSAWNKISGNLGIIYQTVNGGLSWNNVTPVGSFTNATSFADFVVFVTPTVGICLGDPVAGEFEIWKTINSGTTWAKINGASIPNPLGGEYGLTDSYFSLGNTIWFGTNVGRVYRSTDAGSTWTVSTAMPGVTETTRIAFTDQNNGLCAGLSGAVTNLFQTTNGGLTWTNLGQPINFGNNDIAPITGTTWFASVSNQSLSIAYTSDLGITWNSWGGSNIGYLQIGFANNNVAWAGTFSDNVTVGLGGVYKYSGAPLGVTQSNYAPRALNTYPNPSNGIIYLTLPSAKKGLTILISDAIGNVVYSEKAVTTTSEEKILNLQHLSKGIYFVDFTSDNEVYHQKIAIE